MHEAYFVGLKTYPSVRIRPWSPIFEISLYDAVYAGQLAAYLVVSSGQQLHLYKVVAVGIVQPSVIQTRYFGIRISVRAGESAVAYNIGLVLLDIAEEPLL